jgi:hypothetical protein
MVKTRPLETYASDGGREGWRSVLFLTDVLYRRRLAFPSLGECGMTSGKGACEERQRMAIRSLYLVGLTDVLRARSRFLASMLETTGREGDIW